MDKGEFVAIMGPSGSGKSTFLNVISTIDSPTSGDVVINGKNRTHFVEKLAIFRRQELGFVFQNFNLLDTLTIGENIVLPLTLDNVPLKEMDEKLDNISKSLELIVFWTSVFLKFLGTSTAYRSSTCCYSSSFTSTSRRTDRKLRFKSGN